MFWWDDSLLTGIEKIDKQHKDIFEKAEKIFDLDLSSNIEDVNKSLIFLMNYSITHFSEEEQAMLKYHYEYFKEHRDQHNYFVNEIYAISQSIKNKGIDEDGLDSLKVLVIEWLGNHIHESDKKFAKYIDK